MSEALVSVPETTVQDNTQPNTDNSLDTTPSKSNLFGKNYSDITFEDLGLDKPIAGKYNKLGDLENGYKELSTKLREKLPQAPEEYKFDFSADDELKGLSERIGAIDVSKDPMLTAALPIFKKHGVSQEAAQEIVKAVLMGGANSLPDPNQELEKLGGKDAPIVKEVGLFLSKFPAAEQQVLMSLATTAEGVKVLDKIRQGWGEKAVPVDVVDQPTGDPQEYFSAANKIKQETPNFSMNTDAIKRYEDLMKKGIGIEAALKRR